MSNIFEIDGEIEDNFDENGDDKNSKKDKKGNEDESLPTNDALENDEETEVDSDDSESDSHWYDKYLADEEDSSTENDKEADEAIDSPVFEIESAGDEPDLDHSNFGVDDDSDLPTVDDITQEEIDEVLAEIDQNEKELEEASFENETQPTNGNFDDFGEEDEDNDEPFDEVFPRRNSKPIPLGTWTFVTLFLISLTLLGYYQFYDGSGFSLDFTHKSKGKISHLDSITIKYSEQVKELDLLHDKIKKLNEQIEKLNTANLELMNDTANMSNVLNNDGTPANTGVDLNNGTFFQVQLIALQQYHPSFGESEIAFYVDKEDGFSKMLMGAFVSEEQAKILYEKVRKAGFNDAFIVKKVNGKRVEYSAFQ